MDPKKKERHKKILLPAAFVLLLIITIIFHQRAYSRDKETLGTVVSVQVTDIKVSSSGLTPGKLQVTASYQGESYKLHGVPSSAHFAMENSRKYHSTVSAVLYDGKLYHSPTSILLLDDKIYYAALAATFFLFCLMSVKLMEKLRS